MARVYLSLGSNLGERRENIEHAIDFLSEHIDILKSSSYYETAPVDYLEQEWFLNIVLEGETGLEPEKLLEFTQSVEKSMKRVKNIRFGPRNIDVDILMYDDVVYHSDDLILPHPRMMERAFVLVPLLEIAPELEIGGVRISDLPNSHAECGIRKIT